MRIYHLARKAAWAEAEKSGVYTGTPEDRADGFIHFSTATQVEESAAKHRAGETDLLLVSVDEDRLGDGLKWEPSRGGQLFPHLYGDMPLTAAIEIVPLPLGDDGLHQFPALTEEV
ncbi:DUF952 domain-containing protein [Aestuariispira ectoiniformans]|uniref:DUF952 domain-containing protein n=1 Tax=Aestuariispira ectoiniformans TaxID=2775080 RepID=UPI00223A88DA|nr:DUF952 domain-containing protein [Aestuariispira ectoiniformans]